MSHIKYTHDLLIFELNRSMSISSKSNRDRGKSTDILDLFKSKDGKFIHREKEDAGDIDNHVIVFGSMTHLYLFVVELRRNVVCEIDFHPIIVVSEEVPPEWVNSILFYSIILFIF